jgi:hypothetical protein
MSSIIEEIQELKLRILQLEKQQNEKYENDRTQSIEHNFNFINDILINKKISIDKYWNKYLKMKVIGKHYMLAPEDQQYIYLDATYNILHILDNRLNKLESK